IRFKVNKIGCRETINFFFAHTENFGFRYGRNLKIADTTPWSVPMFSAQLFGSLCCKMKKIEPI
ncbi:MAG: hypothetical protein ACI4BH_09195, partial [Muribaculaceae bacterium]